MRTLTAYCLTGTEAVHVVRMLCSVVHGFATLEGSGGFGLSVDLDESFRQLLQVFIAGLYQLPMTGSEESFAEGG